MATKEVELEEHVENAATCAVDCADKLEYALRILKKMGSRPVSVKKLEALKNIADNFAEDLSQMAEEITDARLDVMEDEFDEDAEF